MFTIEMIIVWLSRLIEELRLALQETTSTIWRLHAAGTDYANQLEEFLI